MSKFIRNLIATFFLLAFFFFYGCASAPVREGEAKERIVYVDGVKYIRLSELIQNTDLNYEYDTFLRSIALSNGQHHLNFILDEDTIIYDNDTLKLNNAALVENGEVIIPLELREKVINAWFAKAIPISGVSFNLNIKKVVVDAGHGGKDPGAIGRGGLREKDVVLDIAKDLQKELSGYGIQVVMTRNSDVFIPLEKRAEIANNAQADLFVSIHINAHRDRGVNGLEVYYLSNQVDDYQRACASKNDSLPRRQGFSYDHSASSDLKAVIWDLIYTGNRKQSALLAKEINKKVGPEIGLDGRGTKGARFYVLMNTKIPAILVELGFISNRAEENKLKNKNFRKEVANVLAKTIISSNSTFAER